MKDMFMGFSYVFVLVSIYALFISGIYDIEDYPGYTILKSYNIQESDVYYYVEISSYKGRKVVSDRCEVDINNRTKRLPDKLCIMLDKGTAKHKNVRIVKYISGKWWAWNPHCDDEVSPCYHVKYSISEKNCRLGMRQCNLN